MAFDPLARGFADPAALLRAQAAERPAQVALRQGTRECSYAELDGCADRIAAALQRDGVVAGDTVAFCADSSIEYLGAMYGALRAGAAVVPLAGTAHPRDLAAMVGDCGARHLFVDAAAAGRLQGEPIAAQRIVFDAVDDGIALLQWWTPHGVQPAPVAITAAMRFAIIYSSGTTGAPKGIVQSHGMRWAALAAGAMLGYTPATVSLVSTPLYSNTTLVGLLPTIAFGGCAVLMRKFDAGEFLRLSQRHRVTHAMLVPTQYARLLAVPDFDAFDLSSYQVKLCTSAPFAARLKAEVLRRWPGQLIEFYGLTEGGGTCVLLAGAFPNKLHTVGVPVPGHDMRVIDEQGRELPRGEIGEVVGRSAGMMDGYHGQPQRSAEAEWRDPQGRRYLRSGDIGRFDAEGFLTILDRRKDLIISGGFNIYPGDLEAVLTQHAGVAEAAVIGVPSAQWGETPVAFVVAEPGAALDTEDLRVWANARLGKTQRIAALHAIDELPRSAIGKLLKHILRERLSTMPATAARGDSDMNAENQTAAELSHVRGSNSPPLLEYTIGSALQRAVQCWPQREALVSVHQDIRWTYAEFGQRVDRLAAAFLALGLQPGDRVGMWACNCVEWTLTQFATAKAGLIQVNINPAYRLSEAEYTLRKVGVKALVTAESFRSSDYVGMIEALAPEIANSAPGRLQSAKLPMLDAVIKIGGAPRPGWYGFDELPALAQPQHIAQLAALEGSLDRNQAINIQFTSGTTGLPKGATLSHRNILNNGYFVGASMGLREGDRLCIPVPLYHCFGMVMGNLACVAHGATMVYPAPSFDPLATLKTIEAERCTGLHGVPTMFIAQLEHPEFPRFDLSSLRTGIMAGAPCPEEVMRKVLDRMHMSDVTIAYGMTETSPVSFQSSTTEPVARRVSTVGRVQPHLECKVIDEAGNTVPRGQRGELCTRGYSVMLGYWDDAAKTAEAVDADGYMHTGDLAVIDDEGYCAIVGRIKDMVIRGGENIYPREIEEFLFRHPKIEDVQVVGVPDPKFGEEVCAWIRLRAGESLTETEVRDYCRGSIAHYKIPRYVRFVETFPMTVTGKIQKYLIREAMVRELGQAS